MVEEKKEHHIPSVIAVGGFGSGKSSLLRALCNYKDKVFIASASASSCTKTTEKLNHKYKIDDQKQIEVELIDTPGTGEVYVDQATALTIELQSTLKDCSKMGCIKTILLTVDKYRIPKAFIQALVYLRNKLGDHCFENILVVQTNWVMSSLAIDIRKQQKLNQEIRAQQIYKSIQMVFQNPGVRPDIVFIDSHACKPSFKKYSSKSQIQHCEKAIATIYKKISEMKFLKGSESIFELEKQILEYFSQSNKNVEFSAKARIMKFVIDIEVQSQDKQQQAQKTGDKIHYKLWPQILDDVRKISLKYLEDIKKNLLSLQFTKQGEVIEELSDIKYSMEELVKQSIGVGGIVGGGGMVAGAFGFLASNPVGWTILGVGAFASLLTGGIYYHKNKNTVLNNTFKNKLEELLFNQYLRNKEFKTKIVKAVQVTAFNIQKNYYSKMIKI